MNRAGRARRLNERMDKRGVYKRWGRKGKGKEKRARDPGSRNWRFGRKREC